MATAVPSQITSLLYKVIISMIWDRRRYISSYLRYDHYWQEKKNIINIKCSFSRLWYNSLQIVWTFGYFTILHSMLLKNLLSIFTQTSQVGETGAYSSIGWLNLSLSPNVFFAAILTQQNLGMYQRNPWVHSHHSVPPFVLPTRGMSPTPKTQIATYINNTIKCNALHILFVS